jgi:hypothetical protein
MGSMAAELSDLPATPNELEDFVAALFQASGHFVEKNIHADELELDLVATNYREDPPLVTLGEAKSGGWGYGELFKLVGWMRYLDIDGGALFCQSVPADKDLGRVQQLFKPLGVAVANLADFADPVAVFREAGFPEIAQTGEVTQWRWVHAAERMLIDKLIQTKKSASKRGPAAVLRYHRLVNDGIFFERSIRGRLVALYEAYQSHPRLALSCACELDGKPFDPAVPFGTKSPKLGDALLKGEHLLLQTAFYVEHRARLAILKSAIDLSCRRPKLIKRLLGGQIASPFPATFDEGLRWLVARPTYRQYARLWQVFLWSWGGFYLMDREEQEFEWMAQQSGVPRAEIPEALTAFDQFFPIGDSWLAAPGMTMARRVKMMPAMFHGLGAYHRSISYGIDEYADLGYGDYTGRDLAKWHNVSVAFFTGEKPP